MRAGIIAEKPKVHSNAGRGHFVFIPSLIGQSNVCSESDC